MCPSVWGYQGCSNPSCLPFRIFSTFQFVDSIYTAAFPWRHNSIFSLNGKLQCTVVAHFLGYYTIVLCQPFFQCLSFPVVKISKKKLREKQRVESHYTTIYEAFFLTELHELIQTKYVFLIFIVRLDYAVSHSLASYRKVAVSAC
jgi:hypothetical protein